MRYKVTSQQGLIILFSKQHHFTVLPTSKTEFLKCHRVIEIWAQTSIPERKKLLIHLCVFSQKGMHLNHLRMIALYYTFFQKLQRGLPSFSHHTQRIGPFCRHQLSLICSISLGGRMLPMLSVNKPVERTLWDWETPSPPLICPQSPQRP